ncbi:energy transducer TonB [Aquiflexum sp. LQ15W]|uniref:energy transducer TonB n=1 Tax=Cognataquiflexum nitidum TaxID=2922272 RepID=UPI001F1429E8|nr:energy transducer TonB [Cognataquiflexum nitidum]MCH6201013.1 energy transducer TonB [Cognataquiflexum nitidum]
MKANNSTPNYKSSLLTALPLMGLMIVFLSCDFQGYDEKVVLENGEVTSKTIETNEIFDIVEESPSFPGGMEAWNEFLMNHLKYPEQAKEMGIEGTVYVVFEIRKDGSVENAELIRGIGAGCDEEALRVIKESPNWTPGKQRGHIVNVRMRVPIKFKLGDKEVIA